MGQFSSDSFAAGSTVALESYSANWAKFSGDASMSVSATYGRVYYGTSSTSRYNNTAAAPASADYSVSVDVYVASTLSSSAAGVLGRSNGSNTFYLVRTVQGTGYQMFKCVSGSYTQLGSTSSKTFSSSTTYNVKLEMIGTAIKCYVEGSGSALISATDSAISSAGYPGIYKYELSAGSETTGHHVDNFSADESSGATNTTITPSVGSLAITGVAPTLAQTTTAAMTPTVGALSLTGVAPTVTRTTGAAITPTEGALTLAGMAPTVTRTTNAAITPTVGALAITGIAPTVSSSTAPTIAPTAGAMVLEGVAPTLAVTANQAITVTAGALAFAGIASTAAVTGPVAITPSVGSLALGGVAPTAIWSIWADVGVSATTWSDVGGASSIWTDL